MRVLPVLALAALFCCTASAHLCNNIYRTPDRIIVKPEKTDLILETGEQLRVFVRNNYPTKLTNLRLLAQVQEAGVQATVEPAVLGEMLPAQKEAFTIRLRAAEGAREGRYRLMLSIAADNIGWNNAGTWPAREATKSELLRVLQDGNPSCRVLACESLARLGNQAGIDHLRQMVQGRDGREYTVRAIRAVGRSGNRDLVGMVLPLLDQRDGLLKGQALLSMGMLKAHLERVASSLQDRDPFVRVCGATALLLAGRGDAQLVNALAQYLAVEDPWIETAAAWGCVWAGRTQALEVLERCFRHPDSEVVVMAGDALLSLAEQQEKKQPGEAAAPLKERPHDDRTSDTVALADLGPERLYFNPKLPLPAIDEGGVLQVQLYHTYPAPLHEVSLSASGPGLQAKSETAGSLRPTEIRCFDLPLRVEDKARASEVQVRVTIRARELKEPATFTVMLPGSSSERASAEARMAQPVGHLDVRVQRFGDWYGFAWGVPLVAILGVLFWRKRHQ